MVRCVYFSSILENPTVRFEADLRHKVIAQVQSGRAHKSFARLLTTAFPATLLQGPQFQSTFLKQDPLSPGAGKGAVGIACPG